MKQVQNFVGSGFQLRIILVLMLIDQHIKKGNHFGWNYLADQFLIFAHQLSLVGSDHHFVCKAGQRVYPILFLIGKFRHGIS